MRFYLLILTVATQVLMAQTTRFVYEMSFKPDSTNRTQTKTESVFLDVEAQKSIFYSEKRMQRDSLFSRMRETRNFNFDRSLMDDYRTAVSFSIEKDYASQNITFKNRIAADTYSYTENNPTTWEILPETAKIGNYETQKAKTTYGGRTWIAWFTTEIPMPDGPYKFFGLPGLIVKVEDTKGDYSFDLKESKKIPAPTSFSYRSAPIEVKKKDYQKIEQRFKEDPISFVNRSGGPIRIEMDAKTKREMEEKSKKESAKNNNPIELD
ncbi:GLPGLI family protein [Riemerella anatipestifer]|nr:GLPGLI family protein [Riemerella anatipestifer]